MDSNPDVDWPVELPGDDPCELLRLACVFEATARKVGNVHPGASFHDLTYADFLAAAQISAPILAQSGSLGIGHAVLAAIQATRQVARSNVNLGIALLLAPLAAVPSGTPLAKGIASIIESLSVADAVAVYQAIGIANAGGLGEIADHDVATIPQVNLLEAMILAKDRDGIAREYSERFQTCIVDGPSLWWTWYDRALGNQYWKHAILPDAKPWELATIATHVSLIARGDTLIHRKCGPEESATSRELAKRCFVADRIDGEQLARLDDWLRADGHRRNPGTTADLIAGILYQILREGR